MLNTQPTKELINKEPRLVRQTFEAISCRYDLLNTILSFGRDYFWRRALIKLAKIGREERILDVCAGTGSLTGMLGRETGNMVVGIDFSDSMLRLAKQKNANKSETAHVCFINADALQLPFKPGGFDLVCAAFAVRNFSNLKRGLGEMYSTLRPGGRCLILEFFPLNNKGPKHLINLYVSTFIPIIAGLLTSRNSYRYLSWSIKTFISPSRLKQIMEEIGFNNVHMVKKDLGVVYILYGVKQSE